MSEVKDMTVRLGLDVSKLEDATAVVASSLPAGVYDAHVTDVEITDAGKIMTGYMIDEAHAWPDGAEFMKSIPRSRSVEFTASFDPGFKPDPAWRGTRLEPDAPDGSGCDHPEDQREPLPYQGRAADPDEWECGACGAWNMATASVRDDFMAKIHDAYKVPPSITGFGAAAAAGQFAAATGAAALTLDEFNAVQAQVTKSLAEGLAKTEAAVFTNASTAEVLEKIGATPKFDAMGSLEIEVSQQTDVVNIAYATGDLFEPAFHAPTYHATVRGPVTDDMSSADIVSVIHAAEVAMRKVAPRTRTYEWVMDHATDRRVQLDLLPTSMMYFNNPQRPATLILGHPVKVSFSAHPRSITLVGT